MRRLGLLVIFVAIPVFAAKQRAAKHPVPPPTFSNEIVRIFQEHCQSCHHEGDIAPFALMTYDDVKPHAAQIKFMTATRQMPPWKPEPGCGDFAGDRRLSDAVIGTIARWVDAGAPEGDPARLPPQRHFASEWSLGTPDVVLANSEAYTPPLDRDTYRCFTFPTSLAAKAYVRAIDLRPGDRTIVHHVMSFIDRTGASVALDEADPGLGYTCFGGPGFENAGSLGGWTPGQRPLEFPEGVALELPAGARVVLQVHYHPHHAAHDGADHADRTQFGIYFSQSENVKPMYLMVIINRDFTIPAGDPNYEVNAAWSTPAPSDLELWFLYPHMHLLGKSMQIVMTTPDGATHCLIDIENWDFNWQGGYLYKQPVEIPAGSMLSLVAHYDNSERNPNNPNNPPKPVSWGESTTDEMCVAMVGATVK